MQTVNAHSAGTLVTCGRDNVVRVVDLRTFEPRVTLRAPGFAVGAVWTNACLGPDERHAAAGAHLVLATRLRLTLTLAWANKSDCLLPLPRRCSSVFFLVFARPLIT